MSSIYEILVLLFVSIIGLIIFGKQILMLIGSNYANSYYLLILLAFSSPFNAICQVYFAVKKTQNNVFELLIASGCLFCLLLIFSYWFLLILGTEGIGYAWIICYGLTSAIFLIRLKREGFA